MHTVCFGEDSYISTLKGWIEQQLAKENDRTVEPHWFSLTRDRSYLRNILEVWDDTFDAFSCHIITIGEDSRTGDVLAEQLVEIATATGDADEINVLAAGSPKFLACIERTRQGCELPHSFLLIQGAPPSPVGARP